MINIHAMAICIHYLLGPSYYQQQWMMMVSKGLVQTLSQVTGLTNPNYLYISTRLSSCTMPGLAHAPVKSVESILPLPSPATRAT